MKTISPFLFFTFLPFLAISQPALEFVDAVSGFNTPVDLTGAGDGSERLFITEKAGRIRVYDQATATVQTANFLDITDRVTSSGERGLLGLAFHPDFATNGYFFVNYTTVARNGLSTGTTVIARYTAAPGATTVDPATELVLLSIPQPFSNHNAGDLAFGPDGYLYIPTGDGGGGGDPRDNSQNPQSLLGKMLRIDVDNQDAGLNYAIPATNPFVGDAGTLDEIWAIGLRNPWRISFDRSTGALWIGDVGQGQREEVNFQPAGSAGGQNYGWDCREGLIEYDEERDPSSPLCATVGTLTDPVFDYTRSTTTGGTSITGGFVYRGHAFDLHGYYLAADFNSNRFFLYPAAGGTMQFQNQSTVSSISSFGEDDNGELYVVSIGGTIYRITTSLSLPVDLVNWTAEVAGKSVLLRWQTSTESDARDFVLERSNDGVVFNTLATLPAVGNSTELQRYQYSDDSPLEGQSFYRLRQRDLGGAETLYQVKSVVFNRESSNLPVITPNPAAYELTLDIPELQQAGDVTIQLYSTDGRKVFERVQQCEAGPQRFPFALPGLPNGVYRVRIAYDGQAYVRSVVVRQGN